MEVADELVYKVKTAALLKRGNVTERLARAGYPAASAPSTSTRSVYKGQIKQWPWASLPVVPRSSTRFSRIPGDINAAFFLVQHMPPNFTSSYVQRLQKACDLQVVEVEAGMKVEPGTVYVGRGGRHLNLFKNSIGEVVVRLPSQPDHLFIPSVSIMMDSVLKAYGKYTIGVLMTGMGKMAQTPWSIRQAGGTTIAESEESAIVFGMREKPSNREGRCNRSHRDIPREIIRAVNR